MKKQFINKIIGSGKQNLYDISFLLMLVSVIIGTAIISEAAIAPANYIIYKNGATIYAQNGQTGVDDYSGTDASTVIQSAINALGTNGGKIFIKQGTYDFPNLSQSTNDAARSAGLLFKTGIHLIGESRNSTILRYTGAATDSTKSVIANYHRTTSAISVQGTETDQDISIESLTVDNAGKVMGISAYAVNQVPGSYDPAQYYYIVKDVYFKGTGGGYFNTERIVNFSYNIKLQDCVFGSGATGDNAIGGGGVVNYHIDNNVFLNTTSILIDACSLIFIRNNFLQFSSLIIRGSAAAIGLLEAYNGGYGVVPWIGSTSVVVENNVFIPTAGSFALFLSQSGVQSLDAPAVIKNNYFMRDTNDGNSSGGISVGASASPISPLIQVEALIEGNFFYNLRGTACIQVGRLGYIKKCYVRNNVFRDLNTTPTAVGILVDSTNQVEGIVIENNDLRGLGTSINLSAVPSDMIIKRNNGYVTENSGTATIGSSSTTVAVNHGLSYTPLINDIRVTPTNNLGNAAKFWVSNPTATQFTINIDSNPGGGNTATFSWRIIR